MAEIRRRKGPWQGARCMGSIGLLTDGLSGRRQVAGIRHNAFHFNFTYRIPFGTVVTRNPLSYAFFFSLAFDLGGNKAGRTKNCRTRDTHVKDPYIASRGLTNDTIRNLKMNMGRMRQRIRSMAYSFVL